jgi:hypothetical protein
MSLPRGKFHGRLTKRSTSTTETAIALSWTPQTSAVSSSSGVWSVRKSPLGHTSKCLSSTFAYAVIAACADQQVSCDRAVVAAQPLVCIGTPRPLSSSRAIRLRSDLPHPTRPDEPAPDGPTPGSTPSPGTSRVVSAQVRPRTINKSLSCASIRTPLPSYAKPQVSGVGLHNPLGHAVRGGPEPARAQQPRSAAEASRSPHLAMASILAALSEPRAPAA